MIHILHQTVSSEIQEDEVDGGIETDIWSKMENLRRGDHLGDLGIDWRIILILVPKK
jgi:hypothetical protein